LSRLLLLVSLLLTIPRWAAVLGGVDDLITVRGIPVTAVALAVVMELGTFTIVGTYTAADAAARAYTEREQARRDAARERNPDAKFRKPLHPPELRGRWSLAAVYGLLLAINIGCQIPWVVAKLQGHTTVAEVIRGPWLWGYAGGIVVAAEVCALGVTLAIHFRDVVQRLGVKRKDAERSLRIPWERIWCRILGDPVPDDASGVPRPEASPEASKASEASDAVPEGMTRCELCGDPVAPVQMGTHRRWHCPAKGGNGSGAGAEDVVDEVRAAPADQG
jgi:hypothetical protein